MRDRFHVSSALRISALGALLSISACKVTSDYKQPSLAFPAEYKSPKDSTAVNALGTNWWVLFDDPQLTTLEEASTRYNPDLQAAMQRVVESREAAKAVRSQFFPVVNANPAFTRTRSPRITRSGSSSSSSSSSSSKTTNTTDSGVTSNSYQIPFDLSYEVDLWGRIARGYESSKAQAQAAAYAYFVVQQSLHSDVAVNYFNMRSFDAQARILEENVELYKSQLALTEKQLKAGIAAPTDVYQVQTLLNSTEAQASDIRRQRGDAEHALAILTGRSPSELTLAFNPLVNPPPVIPVGLPIELLRRRPDVAQAEQLLRAANADVGVAQTDFLPRLTLTGAAGLESIDLAHAVDWESRVLSFGPQISAPIFEGGRLTAQLRQAQARYNELLATYRSTILGALRDVDDSLNDLHYRAEQAAAQRRAVESAQEYLRLSIVQRDKAGSLSPLQLIDADRTLLTNQLTEAQVLNERLVSTVLLIKALGGGWQSPPATDANPPLTTLPDQSPTAPPTDPVPPVEVFTPTTQPATQPLTQPATQPETVPAPNLPAVIPGTHIAPEPQR